MRCSQQVGNGIEAGDVVAGGAGAGAKVGAGVGVTGGAGDGDLVSTGAGDVATGGAKAGVGVGAEMGVAGGAEYRLSIRLTCMCTGTHEAVAPGRGDGAALEPRTGCCCWQCGCGAPAGRRPLRAGGGGECGSAMTRQRRRRRWR